MIVTRTLRGGFTLVELLVTIAILTVLMGLLLPAIQSTRKAAQIAACKNNLRQWSMGVLNYESAHAKFPTGQLGPANEENDLADSPMIGHLAFTLPFVELNDLYHELSIDSFGINTFGQPWYANGDRLAETDRRLEIAICPSVIATPLTELIVGTFHAAPDFAMTSEKVDIEPNYSGWTNYLGSMGIGFGELPNGLFFTRSTVRTADVTDGLSNTFLIGEVLGGTSGHYLDRNIDIRHSFLQNGVSSNEFFFDQTDDLLDNLSTMFSSRHNNGHLLNFAYADGHVDSITSDVSLGQLRQMASRKGGEITYENY